MRSSNNRQLLSLFYETFLKKHHQNSNYNSKRLVTTLSPIKITEILRKNEKAIPDIHLPGYIRSIECNQLPSNHPIEDRLRIVSVDNSIIKQDDGQSDPTLILGVFDGHGGVTTADIICKRLFNYIALSLYATPLNKPKLSKISNESELLNLLIDLHNSPKQKEDVLRLKRDDLKLLFDFKNKLLISDNNDIAANLKASFNQCDEDLSKEIQENLLDTKYTTRDVLHHYLSAAVSGCCALVMVINRGIGYLASTGDCRSVLGTHYYNEERSHITRESHVSNDDNSRANLANKQKTKSIKEESPPIPLNHKFQATELNEEHNCDNINEIRRLTSSHPVSEQNTMIKHNRLLGHLMPFRAFGDFNYKWPAELTNSCGITKAFGSGVIPSHYKTPPYLIAEPDVHEIKLKTNGLEASPEFDKEKYPNSKRCIVLASDGLWELFESSRDVIETIVDHSINSTSQFEYFDDIDEDMIIQQDYYDENSATYLLRSALRSGSHQDYGLEPDELKRLYHIRLESTLTLPQSVVRNFRDDISIIVLKLESGNV